MALTGCLCLHVVSLNKIWTFTSSILMNAHFLGDKKLYSCFNKHSMTQAIRRFIERLKKDIQSHIYVVCNHFKTTINWKSNKHNIQNSKMNTLFCVWILKTVMRILLIGFHILAPVTLIHHCHSGNDTSFLKSFWKLWPILSESREEDILNSGRIIIIRIKQYVSILCLNISLIITFISILAIFSLF